MRARKDALEAVDAVQLPDVWGPLMPHRDWERWTHRRGIDGDITGQLHLQALGSSKAGLVLVSGHGCTVYCKAHEVQAAVDHVLRWMDR